MVNREKGHVFYWKGWDFEPLRALFAVSGAVLLLVAFFLYVPMPYQTGNEQLKESRLDDLLKSSGQSSINIIDKSSLEQLNPDADFSLHDPFDLDGHYLRKGEAVALGEFTRLNRKYKKAVPQYQVQYQEIPFALPVVEEKSEIKPHIYERPLPEGLVVKGTRASEIELTLTLGDSLPALKDEDFKVPFSDLNSPQVHLEVKVSASGKVEYVIPQDASFTHPPLLSWIKSLSFSPSSSARYGEIILQEEVMDR